MQQEGRGFDSRVMVLLCGALPVSSFPPKVKEHAKEVRLIGHLNFCLRPQIPYISNGYLICFNLFRTAKMMTYCAFSNVSLKTNCKSRKMKYVHTCSVCKNRLAGVKCVVHEVDYQISCSSRKKTLALKSICIYNVRHCAKRSTTWNLGILWHFPLPLL